MGVVDPYARINSSFLSLLHDGLQVGLHGLELLVHGKE